MVEKPNSLLRLDKSQIELASKMLSRVFKDEPVYVYFLTDASKRKLNLHYHFVLRLRYGLSSGEVYATSNQLEGIAVWFPPGYSKMTFWKIIKCGGLSVRLNMGRESVSRQMSINDYLNSVHMRNAPFRHWYLSSLGVAPEHQGKGYAGILLTPMFSRLDEEQLPCYLETQKEDNIPFYQHYGFDVVEETVIPGTTIKNWAMLRQHN